MSKPLFLLVGKSASGKTTMADLLEKTYGYKSVESYTTRKPRYDGERGHIFISEGDFDSLKGLVAYTEYDCHRYGTTSVQLDECDLYVVDIPGVETLLKKYNTKRAIHIIYFDSNISTRILRMINRHDSDMAIIKRLLQDEKDDWFEQLNILTNDYDDHKHVYLHRVDANQELADLFDNVWEVIHIGSNSVFNRMS